MYRREVGRWLYVKVERGWQVANALRYNRPSDVVYKLALFLARALDRMLARDEALHADRTRLLEERPTPQTQDTHTHTPQQHVRALRLAEGWYRSSLLSLHFPLLHLYILINMYVYIYMYMYISGMWERR
jgi:hypothetical protein